MHSKSAWITHLLAAASAFHFLQQNLYLDFIGIALAASDIDCLNQWLRISARDISNSAMVE